MTLAEARKKLADAVEREGYIAVAHLLGCSATQILAMARGERNPKLMRIAAALKKHFDIPMDVWVSDASEEI